MKRFYYYSSIFIAPLGFVIIFKSLFSIIRSLVHLKNPFLREFWEFYSIEFSSFSLKYSLLLYVLSLLFFILSLHFDKKNRADY
jgi:hypothetical protein